MTKYYILKEQYYSAEDLFKIPFSTDLKSEYSFDFFSKDDIETWKKQGKNIDIRMMFNYDYLLKLEDFLIRYGFFFSWINYNNQIIGIEIHPTGIDLEPVIGDCMTLNQYSKNRDYIGLNKSLKEETNDN
jgi:hypothetical protein